VIGAQRFAFAAGPLAALTIWLAPAPGAMPAAALMVAGLAAWMAVWWLTAVIPLAATALLPLVVLPLTGLFGVDDVARRYADPIIFLFMGGFFLAAASERWNLHRRLALSVLSVVGTDASRVVLAIMVATAFVSMWISNTATAAMMLPIVIALLDLARRGDPERARPFGTAVTLGMAYAASIGGIATLIGTPPTAIFAAAARQMTGRPVGFAEWMALGLPLAAVMLAVCWVVLVRVVQRVSGPLEGVGELVAAERTALGAWTVGQRVTVVVLAATALAWVLREPKVIGSITVPGLANLAPGLTDAGIAMIASLVLFATPVADRGRTRVLDWERASRIPWDVLLLFGGGLALAAAFEGSGLAAWLAARLGGLAGAPTVVVVVAVTLFFVLLTELTSNTATAAMGMPLAASLAPALGVDPLGLMAAAALGSALGFMLPVGTPPNALAFGTGAVSVREMAGAGIWLDLAGAALITLAVTLWV
jgi:sodium-dependent dicarboxylate transporter 2/3/5